MNLDEYKDEYKQFLEGDKDYSEYEVGCNIESIEYFLRWVSEKHLSEKSNKLIEDLCHCAKDYGYMAPGGTPSNKLIFESAYKESRRNLENHVLSIESGIKSLCEAIKYLERRTK